MVHHGGRPGAPAGARVPRPEIQALEDLADAQALVDQPAVEHPCHGGFALVDHQVPRYPLLFEHVPIAVGGPPADELPAPRLLQLAPPKALAEQRTLVLGDGALDLQQEMVIGIVAERMLQEKDGAAAVPELFEQQNLVRVLPGEAVGAQHGDRFELAFAGVVPQTVEAGPVEAGAAVPFVGVDMFRHEGVALLLDPGAQGGELTVDGLLPFLALGRDAGVEGDVHGRPPGDSNSSRYTAWRRW